MEENLTDVPSMMPDSSTTKRARSKESSLQHASSYKKLKESTFHTHNSTSSNRTEGIRRLGLVPADLLNSPLTKQHMAAIQEAIIDVMIKVRGTGIKSQFAGYEDRNGWLLIICANRNTAKWMFRHFERIVQKCKMNVTLVKEIDFPKTFIVRGCFPESVALSNEKVLATIEAQNELAASKWKVVQRLVTKGHSTVEEIPLLYLELAVDKASFIKLAEINGTIAYRYGQTRLNLINKKAD